MINVIFVCRKRLQRSTAVSMWRRTTTLQRNLSNMRDNTSQRSTTTSLPPCHPRTVLSTTGNRTIWEWLYLTYV